MKRLLLPLLAALALPTAVNANVDPEVHKLCLPAADYLGCIKAMTIKSNDIQSFRVIEGAKEVSGNSCPIGFAYSGAGYCTQVICHARFHRKVHKDLIGKGWDKCPNKGFIATYAREWGEQTIKATYIKSCPNKEPIIGTNSSCFTKEMIENNLTKKTKTIRKDVISGSVKINCNSPVWKNKLRCN